MGHTLLAGCLCCRFLLLNVAVASVAAAAVAAAVAAAAVNVPVRQSTMRVSVCATCNTFKQLYQARISTDWND